MKQKLLYEKLSYEVRGCAMEVRKNYGPGHKERLYQNAYAEELTLRNSEYELGFFINFGSNRLYIKRIIYSNVQKPWAKRISGTQC